MKLSKYALTNMTRGNFSTDYNLDTIPDFIVATTQHPTFMYNLIRVDLTINDNLERTHHQLLKNTVVTLARTIASCNFSRLYIRLPEGTTSLDKMVIKDFITIIKTASRTSLDVAITAIDSDIQDILKDYIKAAGRGSINLILGYYDYDQDNLKLLCKGLLSIIEDQSFAQPITITARPEYSKMPEIMRLIVECKRINEEITIRDQMRNDEILLEAELGNPQAALSHAVEAQSENRYEHIWLLARESKNAKCFLAISENNSHYKEAKEMFSKLTLHKAAQYKSNSGYNFINMDRDDLKQIFREALYCGLQEISDICHHILCGEDINAKPIPISGHAETLLALADKMYAKNQLLNSQSINHSQAISEKGNKRTLEVDEVDKEEMTNDNPINQQELCKRRKVELTTSFGSRGGFDLFSNQYLTSQPGANTQYPPIPGFSRNTMEE